MENKQSQDRSALVKRPGRYDLPHLIKWIMLVLLVILVFVQLYSGEMQKLARYDTFSWIVLVLKLILIIVIIYLMRIQRCLKCKIIEPEGCTPEETDMTEGILFVNVKGTAGGSYFSHYTLDIHSGGSPVTTTVYYPGGGGSGSSPMVNGQLGKIDTTSLIDGAYEVVLTVYPMGSGSPKVCKKTFTLLKAIVYINRVAGVPALSDVPSPGNANPFDPDAELRLDIAPDYPKRSFGGNMTVDGSAYIYECPGRKIKEYAIRYAQVSSPGSEPTQPAPDVAVPVAFNGMVVPLPLVYITADHYQPWNRVGPAPINLINSWKSITIGLNTYPKLKSGKWNSGSAGSGRYSLLLTAEDTAGHLYHDIQHIWLDNHLIKGKIVKFQWFNEVAGIWDDLPICKDLSMKKYGNIRVMGLAWDPVIDENWWPAMAPNDNFAYYNLRFWKQFGAAQVLTGNISNRVPALPAIPPVPVPTDADAGELAIWNITTLDGGPAPNPYVPAADPLIYRGESCTYTIRLFVTDNTVLNESTTHYIYDFESVKIINDL
ncbi:MAG: hypothetical protein K8S16_01900 [Bacteroidales bacterium]|nr:hypothetical protein [Bacteroidales bacterium]